MSTATTPVDPFATLQEYADNRGVALRVDREKGVIHGVKVLGRQSKKGREYLQEALNDVSRLANGIVVNIDHVEPGTRRSYRDRVGRLSNTVVQEGGVYGDLAVNLKHDLAGQILEDAEKFPESVGLSIDARDGKGSLQNGRPVVQRIGRLLSVNVVANPATTNSLFESVDTDPIPQPREIVQMDIKTLTIQELRESRDDLVKLILTEADEGAKVKSLESQVKALQESIDGYKAKEAAKILQEAIAGELKAAGLDPANKTQVSDIFMEDLLGTSDTGKRAAKIVDRKSLVAAGGRRGDAFAGAPSRGPHPGVVALPCSNPLQESADGAGPAIPPATAPLTAALRAVAGRAASAAAARKRPGLRPG